MESKNYLIYCIFFLLLFSCEGRKELSNHIDRKYSIIYRNEYYSQLSIYDNNDTIYLTSSPFNDKKDCVKIKSEMAVINKIKNTIIAHINYDCVMVNHSSFIGGGYLDVEIIEGDRKITCEQMRINKDLQGSQNLFKLFQFLRKRHKKIGDTFHLN